ncbi:hypothetical protein IV102_03730 [bacterium]|nr:hypothetical protein [bacterium]
MLNNYSIYKDGPYHQMLAYLETRDLRPAQQGGYNLTQFGPGLTYSRYEGVLS